MDNNLSAHNLKFGAYVALAFMLVFLSGTVHAWPVTISANPNAINLGQSTKLTVSLADNSGTPPFQVIYYSNSANPGSSSTTCNISNYPQLVGTHNGVTTNGPGNIDNITVYPRNSTTYYCADVIDSSGLHAPNDGNDQALVTVTNQNSPPGNIVVSIENTSNYHQMDLGQTLLINATISGANASVTSYFYNWTATCGSNSNVSVLYTSSKPTNSFIFIPADYILGRSNCTVWVKASGRSGSGGGGGGGSGNSGKISSNYNTPVLSNPWKVSVDPAIGKALLAENKSQVIYGSSIKLTTNITNTADGDVEDSGSNTAFNYSVYNPSNILIYSTGYTILDGPKASTNTFVLNTHNVSINLSPGTYYANVTVWQDFNHPGLQTEPNEIFNSSKKPITVVQQVQYSCPAGNSHLTILSSSTTLANGPDTNNAWTNATPTYSGNPAWTANIPGATWIWDNSIVSQPTQSQIVKFGKAFHVPGTVSDAVLNIATDNDGVFRINGNSNPSWATSDISYKEATSFDVSNAIANGNNLINFSVTNIGQSGGTYKSNPAGLLYNLTICYTPSPFNSNDVQVSIPDSVLDVGQTESITANVIGGVPPYTSFVWKVNGVTLQQNTRAITITGNSTNTGNDQISVTVTDSANQQATGTGTLTVNSLSIGPATISASPIDQLEPYTLSDTGATGGTGSYSYQWYVEGPGALSYSMLNGATSNTFTYTTANTDATGMYSFYLSASDGFLTSNSNKVSLTLNPELVFDTLSVSEQTVDRGDYITLNAVVTGGTSPYTYNFLIINSNNNVVLSQLYANSLTANSFTFNTNSIGAGTFSVNAIVTDSAIPPEKVFDPKSITVINSGNPTFTVNPPPQVSISPVSANDYLGSTVDFTSNTVDGTPPYTAYQWHVDGNTFAGATSNTFVFTPNAIGSYNVSLSVTDNRSVTGSSSNSVIGIANAPVITLLPANTAATTGSNAILTASITGGFGPFTVELYNITGTKQYGSNAIITPPSGSNTFTINAEAPNAFAYNAIATDTGASTHYTFGSANALVNIGAVAATPIPVTESPTYTYTNSNVLISTNEIATGAEYTFTIFDNGNVVTSNTGTANTFSTNSLVPGTYYANVSATHNGIIYNSTHSSSFFVANAPVITLTPASSSITSGSSQTYTLSIAGGFGPFNTELYNITGSKRQESNVTIASPRGSNTITIKTGPTGTFTYNAIATDEAVNAIFASANAALTVNSAGCTSNCGGSGGGGGGGGGGGNFVPTVHTSGNCTIISNFSQDNQERLTINGQVFNVVENYINPSSAGVSVNGKTYLLDVNKPQNVLNTSGADYNVTLTSVSYLPIVHTVTVEICYYSKQQLKQSSGAGNSMLVSLTTNKTISVQNGPVLLTGSITNGTVGPYKYDFIVTNSTGHVVFNKTDTNSKSTNSTVFTPLVSGIYTAVAHITAGGTTVDSNKRSLTVSALQTTSVTTTVKPTTSIKPSAPPAAVSSWLILLIILLIIIILAIMYYYMRKRRGKMGKRSPGK